MKELQNIGLINTGDFELDHLSPHMLHYCKLNLTHKGYPHSAIHSTANYQVFARHGSRLDTPIYWTLDDPHITGIYRVCAKLDQRLYGLLQSTLPKFFLDHTANNTAIKRSGVNLISHINQNFGTHFRGR